MVGKSSECLAKTKPASPGFSRGPDADQATPDDAGEGCLDTPVVEISLDACGRFAFLLVGVFSEGVFAPVKQPRRVKCTQGRVRTREEIYFTKMFRG
ncbi:hypothetical protein Thiosp_03130 [Thiorhodovibrio litoralis]|nr:hypothetical protein [Thiorhodovibrio winogradskyi]WPL13331.1 hypothetical protein Thiosp_03130 [Thiorhodovibrio litoralis]